MFNVTTVLPHNLLWTNPCIRHNFSTQVFRKHVAQLHYMGPELRYIFWPPLEPRAFWRLVSKSCDECKGSFSRGCEAKRWSHWTCSSLGTIFQPMRINSVPDAKCFCNNKNVLRAQSMVWHFVRHPVFVCTRVKRLGPTHNVVQGLKCAAYRLHEAYQFIYALFELILFCV